MFTENRAEFKVEGGVLLLTGEKETQEVNRPVVLAFCEFKLLAS